MDETLAGLELGTLIIGTTQTVRQLVEGDPDDAASYKPMGFRGKMALALGVGALYVAPAVLVNDGYVGAQAAQIISTVVRGLGLLIAVPGLFGVANEKLVKPVVAALQR
jgi:hypothetical protein